MDSSGVRRDNLTRVEECSGVGGLESGGRVLGAVPYRIVRYQGMSAAGLPIPGLHRIEGTVELDEIPESDRPVGSDLILRLADGRAMRIALADPEGRVLSEGHGPSKCLCC